MKGIAGSAGQYLMSNGDAATPSWSTVDPIWYVDGNDNVNQTSPHLSTTINGLKFDISGLSVNGFVNIDIFGNLRSANGTSTTFSFRDYSNTLRYIYFANGICTGHS